MAKNRLIWTGLKEYEAFLATLPEDCAKEAGHIIEGVVNEVFVDLKSGTPTGKTGNLKRGVVMIPLTHRGQLVPGAGVKSSAFHAHLWEFGTEGNRQLKGKGRYRAGTNRGRMPKGNLFVPLVAKARRKIMGLITQMLARKGGTVGRAA